MSSLIRFIVHLNPQAPSPKPDVIEHDMGSIKVVNMRVGLIVPEPPYSGGVSSYAHDLVSMAPSKIEYVLLHQSSANEGNGIPYDGLYPSANRIIMMPPRRNEFLSNAEIQMFLARNLPRISREENLDIVHTQFGHMPDLAVSIKALGIPVVATAHNSSVILSRAIRESGVSFSKMDSTSKYLRILSPMIGVLERLYVRRRSMIAPSDWIASRIAEQLGVSKDKLFHVPNGIDTTTFKPILTKDKIKDRMTVTFLGRVTALKGINVVMKALTIMPPHTPPFRLLLIGPGDLTRYADAIGAVREKGIQVDCTGGVRRELLPQILASSDVAVSASFIENAPLSLLEAMSCGVPVLASNVGGVPEIVQDGMNGILFGSGDHEHLSKSLYELLSDDALRARLGSEARSTMIRFFDRVAMCRRTENVYESVLATETSQ